MTMKAVRISKFGGPEELKVESIPIPKPGKGQVLIKVYFSGVNPVDTYIRAGGFGPVTFPKVLGMDTAGTVEEVGEGVTEFKKGDRVYTTGTVTGGYAQFTVADVKKTSLLDKSLTFAQGAGVGVPYYTAWKAIYMRAQTKPKDLVLVHGASGAVGLAAVQIAKANGLRVIGTAGTKEGLDLVQKQGAEAVFNHKEADYIDKIKKYTEGKVDVILEMLANVNLNKDLDLLGHRGRVVVVGSRGEITTNPALTMGKEISILGMALMSISDDEWLELKSAVNALLQKGHIKPIIAKEYKLEDAGQAHKDIISNSGTLGKLVLDTSK
ncbi:zeta-crystallin-like [Biomphalaria glabrata]|uniref:Zeta-crystallin-like n=1 Tax=Biomphalaria glabrata TaxID=6526 RepID=A0A9U8EN33_BIOGL|nr:zeta-crystallin-like [Biomphalaria glabrata]